MLAPMDDVDSEIKSYPGFSYEQSFFKAGHRLVAGIDEAGRGPWAGPVVAAAVILDPGAIPDGLDDSKKLSKGRREQLFEQLCASADFATGIIGVAAIDELNILGATMLAMQEAFAGLAQTPSVALIDGNRAPKLPCVCKTIVKGDQLSMSVAAASIIAKVTRDRIMTELDRKYPAYGFASHKGYGTRAHRQALDRYGVSEHHRRSFAPVRARIKM